MMAPLTKICPPSFAPLQRRPSPIVPENRVSKPDPAPTSHRVSKSDPAAAHITDRPHYAATTKYFLGCTAKPNDPASLESLPRVASKLKHSASSKSPSRVRNRLYHFASSKSIPSGTTKPPPSAPSGPSTKDNTRRHQVPTAPTPLRGNQRNLLALDVNFASDVQAWIYGHVKDVMRKAKDETRVEFHLRLEPDEEEVEVTEEMQSDIMACIEADDEEEAKMTEEGENEEEANILTDIMAYMDADDEEEGMMVTTASPQKMITITTAEVEEAKTIKTGDVELEMIRGKTTEEMQSDLMAYIDKDEDEEGCGLRLVVTPASPKKITTITATEFEASRVIEREIWGPAGPSAQGESVTSTAQMVVRKDAPVQVFHL
jgi:hypothetical protein